MSRLGNYGVNSPTASFEQVSGGDEKALQGRPAGALDRGPGGLRAPPRFGMGVTPYAMLR